MSEQSKRFLLIFAAFVVIVIGAYYLFRDSLPSSNRFTITITDCTAQTDKELKVEEGDEVTLLVTADQDAEFHIHGYDLKRDLTANQEEKIVFKASDPGKYEFELENECELGTITVTDSEGNVPESTSDEGEHNEESHMHDVYNIEPGQSIPTVNLTVHEDPNAGWNLQVETTNFTFSPQNVSKDHINGEGHAHVYVDGEKINRVYGEWYYISSLEAGSHEIRVTLNANDHKEYAVDGETIADTETVMVHAEGEDSSGNEHSDHE